MIRRFGQDYISSQEAARRYDYSECHIQTLARLGKVNAIKLQGVVFITVTSMNQYAQEQSKMTSKARCALRGGN